MAHRLELNITKSKRGWSIENIMYWEGWPNPAYTYSGESTLAIALWSNLDCEGVEVSKVTVKGRELTPAEIYSIIEKALAKSTLAYRLPVYRRVLGLS